MSDYLKPIFERVAQESEELDIEIRERVSRTDHPFPGWTRQDAERLAVTVGMAVAWEYRPFGDTRVTVADLRELLKNIVTAQQTPGCHDSSGRRAAFLAATLEGVRQIVQYWLEQANEVPR